MLDWTLHGFDRVHAELLYSIQSICDISRALFSGVGSHDRQRNVRPQSGC